MLNASFEPINVCTVRRATVLLLKERAELLEHADWALHAETLTLPRPIVIRLTTYVKVPRDAHRRKITRRAVFARDRWTCQYCGHERGNLTVDHVIPRSKGGDSTWENIVTCCAPCNRRKGDRLPRQVGMKPRHKPRAPSPTIFIHVASPTIPAAWEQYLAGRLAPGRRQRGSTRGARDHTSTRGAPPGRPSQFLLDLIGCANCRPAGPLPTCVCRRCRGWTPLDGAQLRSSGRTPPGSRNVCQSSSDHLLSLVTPKLPRCGGWLQLATLAQLRSHVGRTTSD